MANFLQSMLGPLCTVDVEFASGPTSRPPVTVKGESGKAETLPLFTANDTVRGQVHITPAAGKKIEHQGIKVELLGTIELFFDRGNTYDFVAMGACVGQPLALGAGTLHLTLERTLDAPLRAQCASWSRPASSPPLAPTRSSSTTWRCPTRATTASTFASSAPTAAVAVTRTA